MVHISEPERKRDRASVFQRFVSLYVIAQGNPWSPLPRSSLEVVTLLKLAPSDVVSLSMANCWSAVKSFRVNDPFQALSFDRLVLFSLESRKGLAPSFVAGPLGFGFESRKRLAPSYVLGPLGSHLELRIRPVPRWGSERDAEAQ
jgi:hypothetical protein